MSPQTLSWLAAFLAITNTVSALPVEEKRANKDWVTATIDGQVVSWINNWSGSPTTAPATVAPVATASQGEWITATIDGKVVSWINNWPAPAATTAATAPTSVASVAASTTAASSAPATTANSDPNCKDVHIFLSKGWNEPYPGRQGKLAGAICYGLESCDYEDIQFYNAEDSDYCTAVTEGSVNGVSQMQAYAQRCPNSKLVVTGYSQGAHVVGNILGGGDCSGDASPLDPSTGAGKQLKAALLFGDPRHVANQPYNYLDGAGFTGDEARSDDSLALMNRFSGILRSFCAGDDPVCAAQGPGPFNVDDHLNYFDVYSDEAAGWVKWILGY